MTEALSKYDPDFKLWGMSDYPAERIKDYPYSEKSLPYAVKGDLNGDGVEDAVVAGHNKDANLILAVLSDNAGYYAATVRENKHYSWARKKGKEIPYTVTDTLAPKKKGFRFSAGDVSTQVVLKMDGFSRNGISLFDYWGKYDFEQKDAKRNDIWVYEYTETFTAKVVIGSMMSVPSQQFKSEYERKLRLAGPAIKALRAYNGDFRTWELKDYPKDKIADYPYSEKSLPYAVKGDFNGDGKEDWALSGHDTDSNITLAVLSMPAGYNIRLLNTTPCYKMIREQGATAPHTPTNILTAQEKGRKFTEDYSKDEIVIKNDGFTDEFINGCVSMLYTEIPADTVGFKTDSEVLITEETVYGFTGLGNMTFLNEYVKTFTEHAYSGPPDNSYEEAVDF